MYSTFWGCGRGPEPLGPPLPPPLVILPHLPSSSITWLSPKPPRLQTAKIITNRQTDKQTSLSHKLKSWRSLTGEGVKLNLLLRTRMSEGISWYFSKILFYHLDFRISRENGYVSRSAHRTPNFTNPKFQFPQFKVLQSGFFSFLM